MRLNHTRGKENIWLIFLNVIFFTICDLQRVYWLKQILHEPQNLNITALYNLITVYELTLARSPLAS